MGVNEFHKFLYRFHFLGVKDEERLMGVNEFHNETT